MEKSKSVTIKFFASLKSYLSDWKNLLGHAILGVGFVFAAIWTPLSLPIKLVIIASLIAFNLWRMNNKNKQSKENNQEIK